MILWWLEWIPMFVGIQALILSQSKRLCVIEYGWATLGGRLGGQSFFLYFFLIRIFLIKPYQLLVHFCYIRELLVFGYLKDESVQSHPGSSGESEYAHKYFRDFYHLEAEKEGMEVAGAYMSSDPTQAIAYDKMDNSDVSRIQGTLMTGQDDPFTIRNQEIRAMQASGQVDHGLKSIRRI